LLAVLDASSPSSLHLVSSMPLTVSALALKGTTLYAGTYVGATTQLKVFDVSTPAAPALVQTLTPLEPGFYIYRMQVQDNLLLVAAGSAGLLIYDISRPSAPVLLSHYVVPDVFISDVTVDGNLALAAAQKRGGLLVFDISSPWAPALLSHTLLTADPSSENNANQACTVAVRDKIAYLGTCQGSRIYGYDYRNPNYPRVVSSVGAFPKTVLMDIGEFVPVIFPFPTFINKFHFVGTDLYLAGRMYEASLAQMDFSRPRNAINLWSLPDQSVNPDTNLKLASPRGKRAAPDAAPRFNMRSRL